MVQFSFTMNELIYFLLILTRVSCFVFIAPFFSMQNTPARVRIALCVFVSLLLYQSMPVAEPIEYNTIAGFTLIVIKEALAGLLIGFCTNICTTIVSFSGAIADMETGLSMVTLIDPATKQNTSITGVLYQYVFMLILIASGMYRYLLKALADTFVLIPVNGAVFHSEHLLNAMLIFLKDYVMIGFRIVLPIFCVILLLNAVLGVLAKVSPQMNMFAVGMQLKILVGLSVLFLSVGIMPGAADFIFEEMKKMIELFVEGMT